ncbi:MAG: Spy/CpxP family protein refolding chaperone [Hyphomicrobium sp.]
MNKIFAAAALALAMSATAVAPSYAQTNVPAGRMKGMAGGGCPMMGMMGPGMMGRGMMGKGTPSGKEEQMGALADRRLAHLKTELKITDGQADVWKLYADAIKARVTVMQGLRTTMMDAMDKGGTVDRMDIRIKSMEAMVESMKAVKPATEKLYATLTAEQKKVADQLIGVDCGAM